MFWGKKKEDDREKQLKQFKYAFPSLRRPNNDDTLFEIRFLTENQHNALRIAIPPDFPNSKPVLDVVGNVSHAWLDQYKRVTGCPKLNSWSKHSFLTEVVEETLAALSFATTGPGPTSSSTGNLPNLASASNPTYGASYPTAQPAQPLPSYPGPTAQPIRQNNSGSNLIQTANTQPYTQSLPSSATVNYVAPNYYNAPSTIPQNPVPYPNYSSTINSKAQTTPSNKIETPPLLQKPAAVSSNGSKEDDLELDKSPIPLPEIPQSFPELEKLTAVQLERLLTDEVALEKIIKSQTSIEQMTILRDDMRRTNSEKTSKNVLLGEELTALQQQAQQLQTQLKESVNQYLKEYNSKTKKHITNTEDIFKELNRKNEMLDQESEKLGESFVNGEIDTSSFLQQYLDQRVKYHTLNAKLLLTQPQSN